MTITITVTITITMVMIIIHHSVYAYPKASDAQCKSPVVEAETLSATMGDSQLLFVLSLYVYVCIYIYTHIHTHVYMR